MDEKYTEQDKVREQYVKLWEKGRTLDQILPLFPPAHHEEIGDIVGILDWINHESKSALTSRDMLYRVLAAVDAKEQDAVRLVTPAKAVPEPLSQPAPVMQVAPVETPTPQEFPGILPGKKPARTDALIGTFFSKKRAHELRDSSLDMLAPLRDRAEAFFRALEWKQVGVFLSPVLLVIIVITATRGGNTEDMLAMEKSRAIAPLSVASTPVPLPATLSNQIEEFLGAEFQTEYVLITNNTSTEEDLGDEAILTDDVQKSYEESL